MHENEVSEKAIGCAIEVHRELGPGLLEAVYEEALCYELSLAGIQFKRQIHVPIVYKSVKLSADLKLDLLVENKVIIDVKAKEDMTELDAAKTLTYLRLSDIRLGLNINFHTLLLRDGIKRIVNHLI
ncbi:MAG: GxxExxY protein [Candidatus Hydrogenedentes bacterium]|nr:GxxExxY protein [Candidatus Hydrogenedentota bacterium]